MAWGLEIFMLTPQSKEQQRLVKLQKKIKYFFPLTGLWWSPLGHVGYLNREPDEDL